MKAERLAAKLIISTHLTAAEIAEQSDITPERVAALSGDMRTLEDFEGRYGFDWLDLVTRATGSNPSQGGESR